VDGAEGVVEFEPFRWGHPAVTRTSVERVRRALAVDVAGHVAEDLFEEGEQFGEWQTADDHATAAAVAKVLGTGYYANPRRISTWMRVDPDWVEGRVQEAPAGSGDRSDLQAAWHKGEAIATALTIRRAKEELMEKARQGEVGVSYNLAGYDYRPDIIAEVVRAERRAERILKQEWGRVLQLAYSLARRKNHRMTAKQVHRLIGS
jgi:hypothetical protein